MFGINVFDTADVYGWDEAERILYKALEDEINDVVIITKIGVNFYSMLMRDLSSKYLRFAVRKCLERLGRRYIDVLLLHQMPRNVRELTRVVSLMRELRIKGIIDSWGVSANIPYEALWVLNEASDVAVFEVPYNIIYQEFRVLFFNETKTHDVGLIARDVLLRGLLTVEGINNNRLKIHKFSQFAIKELPQILSSLLKRLKFGRKDLLPLAIGFVLSDKCVSCALVGTSNIEHLREDVEAYERSLGYPQQIFKRIKRFYEGML